MKKTLTSKSYSQASYILPTPATRPVVATKQMSAEEQEYEAWKVQQGLNKPLSREAYEVLFNIYA